MILYTAVFSRIMQLIAAAVSQADLVQWRVISYIGISYATH